MRRVEDYLVFSVKDFNISIAIEMPVNNQFTPAFWNQISRAIGKCWIKTAENMRNRRASGMALPEPSKISLSTEKEKKKGRQVKPLTVAEVSKALGISESSVRRIPKDLLRFRKTRGGHRRYATGAVLAYQEMFNWDESARRQTYVDKLLPSALEEIEILRAREL
jgi:hypothetical protein